MKPTLCLHFLLMVAFAIAGCVPASLTPISTQTNTYLPSATVIPATSTSLPTSRATSTLTPPATLEAEQAKEKIRTLLLEPVDCPAPCFWGIKPGETTLGEAENIFTRLGLQIRSITYEGKDFYGIRYDFNRGFYFIVTLTIQDNIVTDLRVDINPETQKAGIPREWSAYSPETLIARYGEPSRVDFFLDWGPSSFFDMILRFDSVDLIVEYTGYDLIPREPGSPQVCPLTAQFDSIGLWMGKVPYNAPHEAVPLEKATSITMEEFSRLMTGDPRKACFVMEGGVFP